MSENYYPQIIVAAVDILGMGTLLSRNDQSVSASDTLETFLMNASYSYAHIERSFESDAKPVFHEGFNFGDSMYFFGDPTKTLQEQADWLLGKCSMLICWGLHLHVTNQPRSYLVRIGIASGDLRVRRIVRQPDQREIETRIGTAMMKAQCLQETQQWIGGAIESSIPRGEHSVYRIQYPVPQSEKKPRVEFPVEAINWVRLGIDNKQDVTFYPSIDNIEETAAAIADPRVRAKWDNTHAFVKHMLTLG